MSFSVLAHFPLGTYKGHVDGEADPLPSPLRLHAAFVAAAGSGVRAVEDDDGLLAPSAVDRAALRWLEAHPPDGLVVPSTQPAEPTYVRFRQTGTLPKEDKVWELQKMAKDPPESVVALDGPVGWTWHEAPPPDVREALSSLAPDVSHLGTAESPVRIEVCDALTPTHERDDAANLWGNPGLDVPTPSEGRTAALEAAHRAYMRGKIGRDSHGPSDAVTPPPRVEAASRVSRYMSTASAPQRPSPWDIVLLIPLNRRVPVGQRVRLAVSFHKALVKTIGFGAPPLVTGHYLPGVPRPANRIALQVITPDMPARHTHDQTYLAVAFPTGADPEDVRIVMDAARQVRRFGPGDRWHLRGDEALAVPAREFWDAEKDDAVETVVPALSDIRPSRARGWSLEDAVQLAVSLAWRGEVSAPGRGVEWMRGMADGARRRGVRVEATRAVRGGNAARFAHHTHPDAVIAPFFARLRLGDIGASCDFVAIGQTRHLGGGLLVPVGEA